MLCAQDLGSVVYSEPNTLIEVLRASSPSVADISDPLRIIAAYVVGFALLRARTR